MRNSKYWHETPLCSVSSVNIASLSGKLLAADRLRNGTVCTTLHAKHEVSVGGPGYNVNTESARLLLLISEPATTAPLSCQCSLSHKVSCILWHVCLLMLSGFYGLAFEAKK